MTPDNVKLADLVGLRVLDGRGEFVHPDDDARVVAMRLDGVLYAFMEDRTDGYRSCLGLVEIWEPAAIPPGSFVEIEPRLVAVRIRTEPAQPYSRRDEVLYGVDEATGLVLFEIGTEDLDDYYPSFVTSWTPEGVSPAWLEAAER